MTDPCLRAAHLARQCGISVVPPAQDGTKRPGVGSWSRYQKARASEAEIDSWYASGRTGVGWVVGSISGNLEVIDFDDRSAFAEYRKLCHDSGLAPLLDRILSGYCEHSPNGAHVAYRCSEIEGNQKLAQSAEHKSLIETRGEGGFIIVAPSHGGVNVKGPYVLQSGGPDTIATITPDERRSLFEVARILDASIKPEVQETKASSGGRPGDDFNARADWSEVLDGWTKVSSRLGVVSWRRPGKDRGISATTNHADSDLLYVFSTSTEFEANRGYSKFSAYALLHHGGDFKAAARELSLQGFGVEEPDRSGEVDISGIMAMVGPRTEAKRSEMADLLKVPGLIGDLAEWMGTCANKRQPILALGASIAAMSAILGRKVQTRSGLRSNLYVVGVGNTGCGKESTRECIKWLFTDIGAGNMIGESFASGSSIETALSEQPSLLYLIDELGQFMGSVQSDSTAGHVKAIIPMLLRIYSSSRSTYIRTRYADSKRNKETPPIEQPSLSLWATTVSRNLFTGITKENMSDGFLNRMLVFESESPDPLPQMTNIDDQKIPVQISAGFKRWLDEPTSHVDGNLSSTIVSPRVVEMTKDARSVFDGLELSLRDKRAAIRKERGDVGEDGPYMRVQATAMKLALCRSCGIMLDNPEITESDARWGCDLALLLTERFCERVASRVFENKTEEHAQRIIGIVKSCPHGISKRDLTRRSQWLKRQERADTIQSLIESGDIVEESKKPTVYKCQCQ